MRKQPAYSYHRSQGVILLVSLILLLAMTLIGISAIDTASLQSQMSRNTMFARNLYQCSLSEIQAQHRLLNRDVNELIKINTSDTEIQSYSEGGSKGITTTGPGISKSGSDLETSDNNCADEQSAAIVFAGNAPPPSGYSLGIYIGKAYEVNSISTVAGTSSQSDQSQGMKRVAPLL